MSTPSPFPIHNRYFGIRHGESITNVLGIIDSELDMFTWNGLTIHGKEQVKQSADAWRYMIADPLIFMSPFPRTLETASIVRSRWNGGPAWVAYELSERAFGPFNGRFAHDYYPIWQRDRADDPSEFSGVEPVGHVVARLLGLVRRLESMVHNRNVMFVSHGDPLQILAAFWAGAPIEHHRDIDMIMQGEIRLLHDMTGRGT